MRRILVLVLLLILSACQDAPSASNSQPTPVPFPSVTPGRTIRGVLPTVVALPLDGSNRANPATAVALANRPTATPNYSSCPAGASPTLSGTLGSGSEMADEIARFLSEGGSALALETALRDDWAVLGDSGTVRGDVDLTGEGTAEVVATYLVPGEGAALLALGCANGRYIPLYRTTAASMPQIIYLGDMNFDQRADILFSSRQCDEDQENCSFQSQVLAWSADNGLMTSLLSAPIISQDLPEINDIETDRVIEIIVRMTSTGTAETGPLRTGVTIYDWDGTNYTRSIVQLDPPRFRIQILRQADEYLARSETDQAIALYETAARDTTLGNWFNDDPQVLRSYTLFRLLTTYAYTEHDDLIQIFQTIQQEFPDPLNAPVYVTLANAFWDTLQTTGNMRNACIEVQGIIGLRPEALDLLNRYGHQGPVYTAAQLCPF